MKRNISAQFKILKERNLFKFSLFIITLLCILSFLFNVFYYFGEYAPDVKAYRDLFIGSRENVFSNILVVILPIIAVMPFCDSFLEDKIKNRLPVILQSCSRKEYYISKLFVSAVSGFAVIFLPMLFNLILNAIAFPNESYADFTGAASNQSFLYKASSEYMTLLPFKNLFTSNPFLYSLLFVFFISVFASAGSAFSYSLSYFIKNRAMVIVPFFIFSTLTSVLSAPLSLVFKANLSIADYVLSCFASEYINYTVFWSIIIILFTITLLLIPVNIKRLGDII